MDKYGLTEIEEKMKLQQYNHAMFRNMLHYMDGVWEINLVDRTVVILESKMQLMLKNKLLQYDTFFNDYAQKIVSPEERKVWFRDFSVVALKTLDMEKDYRFHIFDEHGISRLNNIYVTPAKNEDGEVYCVYVSVKNAELEKTNFELQLLLGSMRMLKSSYYRIGCIDLDRNSMETIEIAEDEKQDERALYADYQTAIVRLVNVYVLAEYRSRLLGLLKLEHIREMFDSGLKYADATYQRLQQGEPHWVRSELMPVAGYGDKHHKVILYVKNISVEQGEEEKLTQKLLYNNERKNLQLNRMIAMINNMLKSINGGLFAYTIPEHKILVINKEAERMFGYYEECKESFGTMMQKNVIPDDVPVVRQVSAALQNVGDKADYDFRTRDRNGNLIYIHANTTMLEFEDEQRFILSSMMDTTEFRQLTNDLNRERSQYRDALTRGSKFCFTFDVTEGMLYDDSAMTQESSQIIQDMGLEFPIGYDQVCRQYITYGDIRYLNTGTERYCSCEGLIQCQKDGVTNVFLEYYSNRFDTYSRMIMLLSRDKENGHVLAYIAAYDSTEEKKKELACR